MKKICKKCGMEVQGKFCSECGSKFELSIQEQLAEMSDVIQRQNKIIESLQRGNVVINKKIPIEKVRNKPKTIEEKLAIIIRYVKQNKDCRFTISEAYKKAISAGGDGGSIVKLKNIIRSRKIPGIRFEERKYRFYIYSSHYKKPIKKLQGYDKFFDKQKRPTYTKRICSQKELEKRRENPYLLFKSEEWNKLPSNLNFYEKNELLAKRWKKEKYTWKKPEHKVDNMLKKKAHVPKNFEQVRTDAYYGNKIISEDELEFPQLKYLDKHGLKLFEQVLINTIANKSTIEFHTVRSTIPLIDNKEWDGYIWIEFCKDIANKREQITKALNCNPNRIKIFSKNGFWVIGGY